jgi:hypothetical protein
MTIYKYDITEQEGEYSTSIPVLFGEKGDTGSTDFNQLTNKPDLAPIALTGSYVDLTDTPEPVDIADKADLIYVDTSLALKVDKVPGKNLSSNDYTAADKNKLSNIASNATANATDASLLSRANHTGTQAQSTVANLVSDLSGKQPAGDYVTTSAVTSSLATKADVSHTHNKNEVGLSNVDNTSDAGKPVSTATQTALNNKQNVLESGISIKTVNDQSILGEGNIEIEANAVAQTLSLDGNDLSISGGNMVTLPSGGGEPAGGYNVFRVDDNTPANGAGRVVIPDDAQLVIYTSTYKELQLPYDSDKGFIKIVSPLYTYTFNNYTLYGYDNDYNLNNPGTVELSLITVSLEMLEAITGVYGEFANREHVIWVNNSASTYLFTSDPYS